MNAHLWSPTPNHESLMRPILVGFQRLVLGLPPVVIQLSEALHGNATTIAGSEGESICFSGHE